MPSLAARAQANSAIPQQCLSAAQGLILTSNRFGGAHVAVFQ